MKAGRQALQHSSSSGGARLTESARDSADLRAGPCDLCGGTDLKIVLRGPDLRLGRSDPVYVVWKCQACNLVQLHPLPPAEVLEEAYAEALWAPDILPGTLLGRLERARELVQRWHPQPGRLLDVGCGPGDFVLAMQQVNWQAQGIDVSEYPVSLALARGAPAAVCADFLTYTPGRSLDAITFNHVLEHVPSPRAYVAHAARLLQPGGILLISVPNYRSLSRRMFGAYWTHLDLPRHLFHFEPETLKRMVQASGLEVAHVSQSMREDNAVGMRDSLRRWVELVLLRRRSAVVPEAARRRRPGRTSMLRHLYWGYGRLGAAITERLGVADTFVLVAIAPPGR